MTDLVRYDSAALDDRWKYAKAISSADDMLPKGFRGIIKPQDGSAPYQGIVPGKVFMALETGAMLGVHPMAALQGINVIEGKASIAPSLMQALVRRAGHKIRVDVTGTIEGGDLAATAKLTRSDEPDEPYTVTWTPFDAVRAGLLDSYEADENGIYIPLARSDKNIAKPWETYLRSMLKWRAQSEVVRDGAEDVLMGVHYTPEELGSVVDDEGHVEPVTVYQVVEQENALIERIRTLDDRADMRQLFAESSNDPEVWTQRVHAAFAGHLMTLTKDTNPPAAPSPGRTGDPDFDAPTESTPTSTEPDRQEPNSASASESAQSNPKPSQRRTAPPADDETLPIETDEERFERESREQYDREMAERDNIVDAEVVPE